MTSEEFKRVDDGSNTNPQQLDNIFGSLKKEKDFSPQDLQSELLGVIDRLSKTIGDPQSIAVPPSSRVLKPPIEVIKLDNGSEKEIKIVSDLPRAPSDPSVGDQSERVRLITSPWPYLQELLEEAGITDMQGVLDELARDEREVLTNHKISELLLKDDPSEINKGLGLVLELDEATRVQWLQWILQSNDRNVRQVVEEFVKNHPINLPEKVEDEVKKPLVILTSEYDIAKRNPPQNDIFQKEKQVRDYGKKGGKVTVSSSSAFERFFQMVCEKINQSPREWNDYIWRLTRLVDVIRYQREHLKINAPKAVESILSAIEKNPKISSQILKTTWDLLSRFEIPHSQELAGSILSLMDKSHDLDHPLATMLLGRISESHPFFQEQLKRIRELLSLCDGSPQDVLSRYDKLQELQRGIISIFPRGKEDEKFGFDWELWPQIIGVPLPEGVKIGIDGSGLIPELRLNPSDEILRYDNRWRERMFDLWLWSITTKSTSTSIHFHVDRQSESYLYNQQRALMMAFFGEDYDDMRENKHPPTFEVRIPFEGYPVEKGQVSFTQGGNPGGLVDFIIKLRQADFNPAADWLDGQNVDPRLKRFLTIINAFSDPATRAAGLIALQRNLGLRILPRGEEYFNNVNFYILQITSFPESERRKFVENLMEKTGYEPYVVKAVIDQLPMLNIPESERRNFVENLMEKTGYEPYVVEAVIDQLPNIPESERRNFVENLMEKTGYEPYVVKAVIDQLPNIPESERRKFVENLMDIIIDFIIDARFLELIQKCSLKWIRRRR